MGDATHDDVTRGLLRWLIGGLVAGGIVLGLLVAAYAIGYHRGHRGTSAAAPSTVPATTTTTAGRAPSTTTRATAPNTVTPQLVARGKALFTADSCVGCHSLTGAAGAGPPLDGVAGATVKLVGGQTATADDAYLERAITDPDAQIVDGYRSGLMGPAIAGFGLDKKPDDVRALVAFLESER